jgi:hypothetical protein
VLRPQSGRCPDFFRDATRRFEALEARLASDTYLEMPGDFESFGRALAILQRPPGRDDDARPAHDASEYDGLPSDVLTLIGRRSWIGVAAIEQVPQIEMVVARGPRCTSTVHEVRHSAAVVDDHAGLLTRLPQIASVGVSPAST